MKGWQNPKWWLAVLLLIIAAPCIVLSQNNFPLRALGIVIIFGSLSLLTTMRKR